MKLWTRWFEMNTKRRAEIHFSDNHRHCDTDSPFRGRWMNSKKCKNTCLIRNGKEFDRQQLSERNKKKNKRNTKYVLIRFLEICARLLSAHLFFSLSSFLFPIFFWFSAFVNLYTFWSLSHGLGWSRARFIQTANKCRNTKRFEICRAICLIYAMMCTVCWLSNDVWTLTNVLTTVDFSVSRLSVHHNCVFDCR